MKDERTMHVTMPDGSTWAVPVQIIIDNRLAFYQRNGTADKRDERPDDYEIRDWAAGNMDWDDVQAQAVLVAPRPPLTSGEMQEGWVNGEKRIV